MECLKKKYTKSRWMIACANPIRRRASFSKYKKWCQTDEKKKMIKMPSIFQRAQVACGGLDYGVRFGRDGGGCCKEWWDGNSFTAGRPQGSTFSTGILSWKRERGGCYCFLLWGQRSSWQTGTFAHRHKWWSGGRSCSLREKKKEKPWMNWN